MLLATLTGLCDGAVRGVPRDTAHRLSPGLHGFWRIKVF
jgi:hypothetical protein